MIYLDSSALVKLVFEEDESAALTAWLEEKGEERKFSSQLSVVELSRTCFRHDPDALSTAAQLLAGLDFIPISKPIIDQAAVMAPSDLRSPDAIHLASASSIGSVMSAFVAYDHRLCAAATATGLPVISPR